MFVLGLTGKTGAGKTTVSSILKEKGCYIIDGDVAARTVTQKGSPVLAELAEIFGSDILNKDGTLNRSLCAKRAFSCPENTEKLNRITHSAIDAVFKEKIKKAEKAGFSVCVIDAAALLESPSKALCSKIAVVTAPEEIRLKRILQRDKISENEAMTRIKAQKSDNYYTEQADCILRNYPPYNIKEETEKLLCTL